LDPGSQGFHSPAPGQFPSQGGGWPGGWDGGRGGWQNQAAGPASYANPSASGYPAAPPPAAAPPQTFAAPLAGRPRPGYGSGSVSGNPPGGGPGVWKGGESMGFGGEPGTWYDLGLLGTGAMGLPGRDAQTYLKDLKQWLAITGQQEPLWTAFTEAALAYARERVNPLTTLPEVHENSVDWARQRQKALQDWVEKGARAVAAYAALYEGLDQTQQARADRLSGFFRPGGDG
ncbi:MAG: hypothetical protein HQL82_13970, partial [Magnetococcales bacterium]|nr:hypothetical protein [Magnetococcales bacterium]